MAEPHPLLERAREAPEKPGVYRFQDQNGKDLYVGKARNLRRRVLSYFGRHDLPERTAEMLRRARRLDFTVTASEAEAFILENTLIKRLRPRFNVLLRDDKTYPYLKLTTGEEWPRIELTRRVRQDGHSYFGPFMGQRMARRLMDLARTHFQVRTCQIEIDGRLPRPCLPSRSYSEGMAPEEAKIDRVLINHDVAFQPAGISTRHPEASRCAT